MQPIFVVADYFATGEGRTLFLLITYAMPRNEDFIILPKVDFQEMTYTEGTLKISREEIAKNEMKRSIDEYYWQCIDTLDSNLFFKHYSPFVPEVIQHLAQDTDPRGVPGNLKWFTHLHFNFS